MEYINYFILIPLVILTAILIIQNHRLTKYIKQPKDTNWDVLLNSQQNLEQNIQNISLNLQNQMQHTQQTINTRLDKSTDLMRLLNQDLGHIHEIGEQIRDFHNILYAPKLRGIMGEKILQDMLYQVLPREQLKFQYRFSNGQRVDVLILTDKGGIPVDAKFPIENFKKAESADSKEHELIFQKRFIRDVKTHIETVSRKYILPEENTTDFAVIYIPAEAIYLHVQKYQSVFKFAQTKNVFITSPNTFYFFLQTLLFGMESLKVEKNSQKIIQTLKTLTHDFQFLVKDLNTFLNHLTNTKNAADRFQTSFYDFHKKLGNINKEGF